MSDNGGNNIFEEEKLAIFEQINNWMRHADNISWAVFSLFIISNFYVLKEMKDKSLELFAICYGILFIPIFLFNICLTMLCNNILSFRFNVIESNNKFLMDKFTQIFQFSILELKDYKKFKEAIKKPWGIFSFIILVLLLFLWIFMACLYFILPFLAMVLLTFYYLRWPVVLPIRGIFGKLKKKGRSKHNLLN